MFKCVDLSKLITFFIIFHNDKPVDWLLDHVVQTKVCRFDKDPVSTISLYFDTTTYISDSHACNVCTLLL